MSSAPLISHARTPAGEGPLGPPGGLKPVRAASPADAARSPATGLPLFVLLAIPTLVTAWGAPYYAAAAAQRLRHPLHAFLKASGPVGLAFGVLALALFVFMWLYPLRKQAKWLAWTGSVGDWMNVHIVMGLALPVLAAVHAGWHFTGLIGLGMLAMVIVSLSGVVGRYLYTHIPRSRSGLELSLEEAGGERRALLTHLAVATGMTPQDVERTLALDPRPYEGLGLVRTFTRLVTDDFTRWRALGRLKREWSQAGADPGTARSHGAGLSAATGAAGDEAHAADARARGDAARVRVVARRAPAVRAHGAVRDPDPRGGGGVGGRRPAATPSGATDMDQWPTTLAVVVLTGLFVLQHLRQRASGAAATKRTCPRCRSVVPEGAADCPRCQAPLQAYAVVTAPTAAADAPAPDSGATLHAVVRADACAGCGTCVDVCPEPGAI